MLEMAAVVGETSWLDAIIALERVERRRPRSRRPDAAQIAASGDHSRISVVAALGKLVEREWLVEVPQSSVPGERELRFAYPNLWALVYQGIDEARAPRLPRTWSRAGSSCPEGRAPDAQEEIGRHLALAGAAARRRAAATAAPPRPRARSTRTSARSGCSTARSPCVGDARPRGAHPPVARPRLGLRADWRLRGGARRVRAHAAAVVGRREQDQGRGRVQQDGPGVAAQGRPQARARVPRARRSSCSAARTTAAASRARSTTSARRCTCSAATTRRTRRSPRRSRAAASAATSARSRRRCRASATSSRTAASTSPPYTCHKEALELRTQAGDRWGHVVSQNNLAALAFELGELAEAARGLARGAARGRGDRRAAAGGARADQPRRGGARRRQARRGAPPARERARDHRGRRGSRSSRAECCRHIATLEKQQGHTQAARELAERALESRGAPGCARRRPRPT